MAHGIVMRPKFRPTNPGSPPLFHIMTAVDAALCAFSIDVCEGAGKGSARYDCNSVERVNLSWVGCVSRLNS